MPSDFDVVPWEGQTHAVFFTNLSMVAECVVDTVPVSEDATLILTFAMMEEVTDNVFRSIDCTVAVVGTHDPTPAPAETPDTTPIPTSTPRPTRTPAPTSTVVPGSHLMFKAIRRSP